MKLLTKQDIEKKRILKFEIVEVKEWDGNAKIIELMSNERDNYEKSIVNFETGNLNANVKNFRARLVALTMVNDDNERLYTSEEDIIELGKQPASVIDKLFAVGQRLSGLTKKDEEALLKNSKGQSVNSNSD